MGIINKQVAKAFYTDGACSGNPGAGGWAYVELVSTGDGYKTSITAGNKEKTTNNEMELTAAYMALVKSLKSKCMRVTIYCDSAYVVNAIGKGWLLNWSKNGWMTKEGKPIKNVDIWKKVYKLIYDKGMTVTMIKLKGHADDPLNDLADKAAVQAKDMIKQSKTNKADKSSKTNK